MTKGKQEVYDDVIGELEKLKPFAPDLPKKKSRKKKLEMMHSDSVDDLINFKHEGKLQATGNKGLGTLELLVMGLIGPDKVSDKDLREFLEWIKQPAAQNASTKTLRDAAALHMTRVDPDGNLLRTDVMRLAAERFGDDTHLPAVYERALTQEVEVMRQQITLFNREFTENVRTIEMLLQDTTFSAARKQKLETCKSLMTSFLQESDTIMTPSSPLSSKLGKLLSKSSVSANPVGGNSSSKSGKSGESGKSGKSGKSGESGESGKSGKSGESGKSGSQNVGKTVLGVLAAGGVALAGYKYVLRRNDVRVFLNSKIEWVMGQKESYQTSLWKKWAADKAGLEEADVSTPEKMMRKVHEWYERAPSKEELQTYVKAAGGGVLNTILKAGSAFAKVFRKILRKIPVTIFPGGTAIQNQRTACETLESHLTVSIKVFLSSFKTKYVYKVIFTQPEVLRSQYIAFLSNPKIDINSDDAKDARWYLRLIDWFAATPAEVRETLSMMVEKYEDSSDTLDKVFGDTDFGHDVESCLWLGDIPMSGEKSPAQTQHKTQITSAIAGVTQEEARGALTVLLQSGNST